MIWIVGIGFYIVIGYLNVLMFHANKNVRSVYSKRRTLFWDMMFELFLWWLLLIIMAIALIFEGDES